MEDIHDTKLAMMPGRARLLELDNELRTHDFLLSDLDARIILSLISSENFGIAPGLQTFECWRSMYEHIRGSKTV